MPSLGSKAAGRGFGVAAEEGNFSSTFLKTCQLLRPAGTTACTHQLSKQHAWEKLQCHQSPPQTILLGVDGCAGRGEEEQPPHGKPQPWPGLRGASSAALQGMGMSTLGQACASPAVDGPHVAPGRCQMG